MKLLVNLKHLHKKIIAALQLGGFFLFFFLIVGFKLTQPTALLRNTNLFGCQECSCSLTTLTTIFICPLYFKVSGVAMLQVS